MRGFILLGKFLAKPISISYIQRNIPNKIDLKKIILKHFNFSGALSVVRGADLPATAGAATREQGWNYNANQLSTEALPAAWDGVHATCAATGTKQSPIDIVTSTLTVSGTDPGNVTCVGCANDLTGSLINDGRSIHFTPTSPIKPYLMGGALAAGKTYVFDHAEFHYGSVSTQGSEHTIDAAKAPLEVQLVHYDSSLLTATLAAASTSADAVVVVSFLFEVRHIYN